MLRVRRQDQEHVLAVPVGRRKQLLMLPGLPTTCLACTSSRLRPGQGQAVPVAAPHPGRGRRGHRARARLHGQAREHRLAAHDGCQSDAAVCWNLGGPGRVRHPLRHGRRDLLPAEDQQRVVLVVRAHEHLRLTGIRSPLRPRPTTPSTVLNELANHDFNIARDEPFWSPDRDEPWRNDYRHQTLVLLALVSKGREHLPGAPSGQITIYIRSNYERAADFIRTTIAPSKPEVAAHLLDQYTPILELAAAGRAQAAALGRPV